MHNSLLTEAAGICALCSWLITDDHKVSLVRNDPRRYAAKHLGSLLRLLAATALQVSIEHDLSPF